MRYLKSIAFFIVLFIAVATFFLEGVKKVEERAWTQDFNAPYNTYKCFSKGINLALARGFIAKNLGYNPDWKVWPEALLKSTHKKCLDKVANVLPAGDAEFDLHEYYYYLPNFAYQKKITNVNDRLFIKRISILKALTHSEMSNEWLGKMERFETSLRLIRGILVKNSRYPFLDEETAKDLLGINFELLSQINLSDFHYAATTREPLENGDLDREALIPIKLVHSASVIANADYRDNWLCEKKWSDAMAEYFIVAERIIKESNSFMFRHSSDNAIMDSMVERTIKGVEYSQRKLESCTAAKQ